MTVALAAEAPSSTHVLLGVCTRGMGEQLCLPCLQPLQLHLHSQPAAAPLLAASCCANVYSPCKAAFHFFSFFYVHTVCRARACRPRLTAAAMRACSTCCWAAGARTEASVRQLKQTSKTTRTSGEAPGAHTHPPSRMHTAAWA